MDLFGDVNKKFDFPVEKVTETWDRIRESVRARLLTIQAAAAGEVGKPQDQAQAQPILKDHVYTALTELSQNDLESIS